MLCYKSRMKPSRHVYEAALRLRGSDLAPFVNWIKSEREEVIELLTTAPVSSLPILQGRAQCLGSILDLIDTAPAVLDKLGSQ